MESQDAEGEAVPKRGRGRPRKWASDRERVRAWRAAERARRQLWSGKVDVDELIAKVQHVESERDRNWQQVLELRAERRTLERGPPGRDHPPPAELTSELVRWQQQAADLAAIVARLTGAGWDHPMFALVDQRAHRAAAEGDVLATSVLDDPVAVRIFARPEPVPTPSGQSRAERRRMEREARRRGRS